MKERRHEEVYHILRGCENKGELRQHDHGTSWLGDIFRQLKWRVVAEEKHFQFMDVLVSGLSAVMVNLRRNLVRQLLHAPVLYCMFLQALACGDQLQRTGFNRLVGPI